MVVPKPFSCPEVGLKRRSCTTSLDLNHKVHLEWLETQRLLIVWDWPKLHVSVSQ